MESVIDTLDEMVSKKIIDDYVLGGATALLYYSDPTFTEDIDIFIQLKSDSVLVSLEPVYEYLKKEKSAVQQDEYIVVGGFPLQFLVPYDELSMEAFEAPNAVEILNKRVKIFSLEFLMAIMIQLSKAKYRERLRILIETESYDNEELQNILERHKLTEKWRNIQAQLS